MTKQARTIYGINASKVFPIIMRHFESSRKPLTKSDIDSIIDNLAWQMNRNFDSLKHKVYGFITFHDDFFVRIWYNRQIAYALIKNLKSFDDIESLSIFALKWAGQPLKIEDFFEDIKGLGSNSSNLLDGPDTTYYNIKFFDWRCYRPKSDAIVYFTKDIDNFLFLSKDSFNYIGLKSFNIKGFMSWPFPSNDMKLLNILDGIEVLTTRIGEIDCYLECLKDIYWNILKDKVPSLKGAIKRLREVLFSYYDKRTLDLDDVEFIRTYDSCLRFMEERRIVPSMQRKDRKLKEWYESLNYGRWILYKHRRLSLMVFLNVRYYWSLILEDKKVKSK